MAILDSTHCVVEANRGYEIFFGLSAGALIGKHARRFLGSEQYENVSKARLDKCFLGQDVVLETSFDYPGVGKKNVRIDYSPIKAGNSGLVEHVLVTIYDITDLKDVQSRLENEGKLLNAVIEGARVGTWQFNAQTNEMIVNDRWVEMLGYTREDLSPINGSTWYRLLHEDDREIAVERSHNAFAGQSDFYDCEFRLKHKDGSWTWVHTRGSVATWENGKALWVFGTHTDITERKKEEERRREVSEALLFRERQISDILKSVPGALMRYRYHPDGSDELLYYSEKAKEVWEVSSEGISDVSVLWGMVWKEDVEALAASIKLSAAHQTYWEGNWRISTPNNHVKWLNGRGDPRLQEDGSVIWNMLVLDVSELKETEQMLRRSEAEARAADRAKTEFLNMMNHELRTPLNAIVGPLDLLNLSTVDEEVRSLVDLMRPAADHLLSLVNDILNLAKMQAGKQVRQVETIELSTLIEQGLRVFRVQAAQSHLEFEIELGDGLPSSIETDFRMLKQTLMNLVSNALKFTESGGVYVRIYIDRGDDDHSTRLCFGVRDTGIGIAEGDQQKIFEPFQQVDMRLDRAYQGTGLGLPIAANLAELLGGELKVSSELGVGSEFTLAIPCESTAPDSTKLERTAEKDQRGVRWSDLSILVVEDTEANRSFFDLALRRLGATATYAFDGAQAIEAFRSGAYDVVFCDIRLPDCTGEEVAEAIRAMDHGKVCTLVAHTAFVTDEYQKELLDGEFDDFLPKPMKVNDLEAVIGRYFGSAG